MTDLEWKIIYVGSASTEEYDQVLDSVLVGPIPMGSHKFVFQVCVCVCVCMRVCVFFREMYILKC